MGLGGQVEWSRPGLTEQGLFLAVLLHVDAATLSGLLDRPAQLEEFVEIVEHEVQDEPRVLESDVLGLQQTAGEVVKQDAVIRLLKVETSSIVNGQSSRWW